MKDWLIRSGTVIIALVSGLAALTAPFFVVQTSQGSQPFGDRTEQLPITMTVVLLLSLLILVFETQYQLTNPRVIALLGVLAALNATLRFVEIAIPGPGGFSPIFLLIICCGYVFGGSFGFLLGILTMVVSAVVTGGIGPWLPAQMYTAGWVGLSAPLLANLTKTARIKDSRWETILLAVLAGIWGFMFGLIMNLWFWPYMSGPADLYMTADVGFLDIVQRFSAFYFTTSLGWDVFRFIGNVLLILLFARPILKTLNRYKARFTYSYSPLEQA